MGNTITHYIIFTSETGLSKKSFLEGFNQNQDL